MRHNLDTDEQEIYEAWMTRNGIHIHGGCDYAGATGPVGRHYGGTNIINETPATPQNTLGKLIINVEDFEFPYIHPIYTEEVLKKVQEHFNQDGNEINIFLPKELIKWKSLSSSRTVLTCAFMATKAYLKNIFGCELQESDRVWYVGHPKMESSGLPKAYYCTILNDLVRPWGFGVSKVWVKKGLPETWELKGWKEALGCNPIGSFDNSTSNMEFVEQNCGDDENVRTVLLETIKNYGVDFVDEAPRGLPLVEHAEGAYVPGVASGTGGGHSEFRGPRTRITSWALLVQFDRLQNITYFADPPTFGEHYEEEKVLDILECKSPIDTNKSLKDILQPKYNKSFNSYGGSKKTDLSVATFRGAKGKNPHILPQDLDLVSYVEETKGPHLEMFTRFCKSVYGVKPSQIKGVERLANDREAEVIFNKAYQKLRKNNLLKALNIAPTLNTLLYNLKDNEKTKKLFRDCLIELTKIGNSAPTMATLYLVHISLLKHFKSESVATLISFFLAGFEDEYKRFIRAFDRNDVTAMLKELD